MFLLSGAGTFALVFVGIILVILLAYLATRFTVVPQATVYVIERLGKYHESWDAGLHFLKPFIYKIRKRVSLKEQVADFQPQPVITKDNVTMQIDSIVFFQITDSKLFTYGVENPLLSIDHLASTTLRNIIGELELDQTLTSRDIINEKMRKILDEATDAWGIKINRVELKNIMPPKEIREAMEKQMRAERERREQILLAEGKKRADILTAEGEREAAILRADALKESKIREAQGNAQAILAVQEATAAGIKMIKDAGADEAFLKLESYKALEKVADGKSTKIIIPSDIQNLASTISVAKELWKDDQVVEDKKNRK